MEYSTVYPHRSVSSLAKISYRGCRVRSVILYTSALRKILSNIKNKNKFCPEFPVENRTREYFFIKYSFTHRKYQMVHVLKEK